MSIPAAWFADRKTSPSDSDPFQKPVTAKEIAAHPEWRGTYVADQDTRQFVIDNEAKCEAWNCWMHRDADGNAFQVSEVLSAPELDVLATSLGIGLAAVPSQMSVGMSVGVQSL